MIVFAVAVALAEPVTLAMTHRVAAANGEHPSGAVQVQVFLRAGELLTDPVVHDETFPSLPVELGRIELAIGSVTPLSSDVLAAEELWVQVDAGPFGTSDPRRLPVVATSAHAVRARRVDHPNAPACDGSDADDLGALRMVGDTLQGCTPSGWSDLN